MNIARRILQKLNESRKISENDYPKWRKYLEDTYKNTLSIDKGQDEDGYEKESAYVETSEARFLVGEWMSNTDTGWIDYEPVIRW